MRLLFITLLMAVASFSQTPPIEPGVSQELARWRAAHYEDVRYKLNLTLEKMSPVLKGTIEMHVTSMGDPVVPGRMGLQYFHIAPVILDWRKIKGSEALSTVTNVTVNGEKLEKGTPDEFLKPDRQTPRYFEHNEHLIFEYGLSNGENVIKLDFTSPILPSGSAITRYIDKEDGSEYIYSLFVPSDASTAFPVFDQPDLKARFDVEINRPKEWMAVSNTAGKELWEHVWARDGQHWYYSTAFEETKPISTYVFAFAAGPWQKVSDSTGATQHPQSVPPAVAGGSQTATSDPPATAGGTDLRGSIYVRRSQLAKFQPHAAEVFRLNREGIKFLEEYFNYKYPFPKYDLVLIPEFPFGGMEHAGATFLRESSIIFPSEPTKNDHISRANLIFHEAAHQWFGDTVTMRWFDDLWLKEGFAEFMAYKTLERVMPQYNAWKAFYERNKQSAYLTDSTKGTTPIYQEIKNLSAAKSAYGNIVYRKAPSFLKQAEFYIGADKFQTAVRAFLKKHEFGNAGWENLVREFEDIKVAEIKSSESYATLSARDRTELEAFTRWSIGTDWVKFWVTGRGMPIYRISPNVLEGNGLFLGGGATGGHTIFMRDFSQNATVENLNWLQNIRVLKAYDNGEREYGIAELGNRRYARLPDEEAKGLRKGEFTFSGAKSGSETKRRAPVFVFPNYQDYGYGIFLLDDKSRDYVLKNIQNEKDDFLRSMMWGSLWDSVREGELDPKEYVGLVIKNLAGEKDETTTQAILGRATTAMTYYMADKDRDAIAARLEAILLEKMRSAPTLGQRITYYRALLNTVSTEKGRSVLKEMLRQTSASAATGGNPTGREGVNPKSAVPNPKSSDTLPTGRVSASSVTIPLKTKDRFDIVTKLASLNDPDAESLLKELERTETSDDAKRYAYAARAAFPTTKEKYWNDFTNNKDISESWIEAAFGPFNSVRHADLTLPYLERALNELPNHKRNRKIFFVNGWLAAFIGGQKSEQALAIVNKFLADNPNLDRDLRLKILENVDVIERAVKIRDKYGR